MKASASRFHRQASGFTLLEMVITMAILLLLSGAIFGIIVGVLRGASTLHENQDRRDEIAALNSFLNKKIGDLGASGGVISYKRDNNEGLPQSGVIINAGAFALAIDTKLQRNGYYVLRTTSVAASDSSIPVGQSVSTYLLEKVTKDEDSLEWATLIKDLKTTSWRFEDPNTLVWSDYWKNSFKPNMVEFSIQLGGEPHPEVMEFWLPPIAATSYAVPPTGSASSNPQMPAPPTNAAPTVNVLP